MSSAVTSDGAIGAARRRPTSRFLLLLILLGMFATFLGALYRRDILDWLSLRNYTPSPSVVSLASNDAMTASATKYFYVNHPNIDEKPAFVANCNSQTEQTIVLGCYHGNQRGIYILSVTDPRLRGVEEVTAAHEMLHAAYDRLNASERTRVAVLLKDYYNTVHDQRIRDTIEAYKKSEPNDVVNEMHSVFGTEAAQLPPELEAYYQRYFKNRSIVVGYANDYAEEFASRQKQVVAYDAQLQALKYEIDANNLSLSNQRDSLSNQRTQLESDRSGGDARAYNARVDAYNSAVAAYNAKIVTTKQLISNYNVLVGKRNAIALEEQALAQALSGDSVPKTAR